MPTAAKVFVTITIAVGLSVLFACIANDHRFPEFNRFVQCLTLALLAATFKVRLPRTEHSISASFVLFLIAVSTLALNEVLVIGVSSCVLQCLWRAKTYPTLVQLLFNVAATAVAVATAFQTTTVLRAAGAVVPALILASVVFFIINSGSVSVVIALLSRQSAMQVWRNCHRWAFPYYLVGAGLASGVTLCIRVYGWLPAVAMLPLMYLVYICYENWVADAWATCVPERT